MQIIEAEACPDHIHMLVSIPPHISIAQFMGYLKGKSTLMIFDRHANLKYKNVLSDLSETERKEKINKAIRTLCVLDIEKSAELVYNEGVAFHGGF